MGFPTSAFPVFGPGSDDLLDPETGQPIGQPKMPPISIDPAMFKTSPATERYRQLMESVPRREDYQVGKGKKIAAALAGSLMALKDPAAGVAASQQVVERPYMEAMEAFNNEAKQAHTLAGIENAEADNLRQYAQMVETGRYHQEVESGRDRRAGERLQFDTVKSVLDSDNSKALEAGRQNRFELGQSAEDARFSETEANKNKRLGITEAGKNARVKARVPKVPKVPITAERRAREEALKRLSEGEFKGVLNYNKESKAWDIDPDAGAEVEKPGMFTNIRTLGGAGRDHNQASASHKKVIGTKIKSRLDELTKEIMKEAGYNKDEPDMKTLVGSALFDDDDDEEDEE